MNPEFFLIAATKTTDPVALTLLGELERFARELADADASFPERINANKAKRGEAPTKLSTARKQQLGELARDQIDLDFKLCSDFRQMTEPSQIVWAIHYALLQDMPNAQKFLKYYHPDDLPLGEELVRLKRRLLEAASAFLEMYPHAES
jgi:hypothetical protein